MRHLNSFLASLPLLFLAGAAYAQPTPETEYFRLLFSAPLLLPGEATTTTPEASTFTLPDIPAGITDQPWSITPIVSGNTISNWTVTPALPIWLDLDGTTGTIFGTTPINGTHGPYTLGATGIDSTASFQISVASAVTVSNPDDIVVAPGASINHTLVSSGGIAPYTYSWITPAASRPAWLNLNSSTGNLTGIASTGNWDDVQILVNDSEGRMHTVSIRINVASALSAPSPGTLSANAGSTVSSNIAASNGAAPYTYSWITPTDSRPAWLNLNSSTGALSGTSAAGAWSNLQILVTDSVGRQHTVTFGVSITAVSDWYAWGRSDNGRMGNGNQGGSTTPIAIADIADFTHLNAGHDASCATGSGGIYCWGYAFSSTPTLVPGTTGLSKPAVGTFHACALDSSGSAYCWGTGTDGQLGQGSFTSSTTPVAVAGGHRFSKLAAGNTTTCGITMHNVAYCWGNNLLKQVGNNSSTNTNSPTLVSGGGSYSDIGVGHTHVCGIRDGAVVCWGGTNVGQTGVITGTLQGTPRVVISSGATSLTVGWQHNCAISSSTLRCWGGNHKGQIGNGNYDPIGTPFVHTGAFSQIGAGDGTTCALRTTGAVSCWGDGSLGQLGRGSNTSSTTPTNVSGGHVFTQLVQGGFTVFAKK